jgi:hypothetical protein
VPIKLKAQIARPRSKYIVRNNPIICDNTVEKDQDKKDEILRKINMQRSKRVASSSKVFPITKEMVRCESNLPEKTRFSDLTQCLKNKVKSVIDNSEDDLFKLSANDLESINGEPTPSSSNKLNEVNTNDLSILSISNKS